MSRTNNVSFRLYMRVFVAAALLACVACGNQLVTGIEDSSSALKVSNTMETDATRIDRSVSGHPLLVHSAVFVQGTAPGWPYVGVFLTDAPSFCSQLNQGVLPASMTDLAFTFAGIDRNTYVIGSSLQQGDALAAYGQSDAACQNSLDDSLSLGKSGSLQLEGLDMNGRLHGRFSVQLGGDGQGVTGAFVAVECTPAVKLFDCSNSLACR